MAIDKTLHIYISKPKYSKEAIAEILGNIRMDIVRWTDIHGERPARILVTPDLHMALRDNMRGVVNYIVDSDRQERLFGIMISRYIPAGDHPGQIMAYHLTGKERRFEFSKEGDHECR